MAFIARHDGQAQRRSASSPAVVPTLKLKGRDKELAHGAGIMPL